MPNETTVNKQEFISGAVALYEPESELLTEKAHTIELNENNTMSCQEDDLQQTLETGRPN